MEMTEREVEKEEAVDVDVQEEEEVEVTLRLATGKKSMSSPPAPRRSLRALARLNPLLPPQGEIKELEYTTPRRVCARAA